MKIIRKTLECLFVTYGTLILASTASSATFTVTNTADSGAGSLSQAIDDANSNAGADTIAFNIPGLGPHTIQPLSALPDITDTVDIDGYSQPGSSSATSSANAEIKIVLDGSLAGLIAEGLYLDANNSRIRGLVINNFSADGIVVDGDNNLIRGCYIGTNEQGTLSSPNGMAGINISGNTNEVGGTMPAHLNIISANLTNGVNISGDGNVVHGNIIGLDNSTTVDLGNNESGISIYGSNNIIGGIQEGSANVISGNNTGVLIGGAGSNNQLQGNIIGTDKTGTSNLLGLGNVTGVILGSVGTNEVGGTAAGSANVISNNIGPGIDVMTDGNIVQGNYIGTDINGDAALANGSAGVYIYGDFNTVGGVIPEARNIISGNDSAGIYIQPLIFSDDKPRFNKVQGNYIGTDVTGTFAIPNGYSGIFMTDADANMIGGYGADAGNLISGNQDDGIVIRTFTYGLNSNANLVMANKIGTDASGLLPVANTSSGVRISGADNNRIGSNIAGTENIIAYNGANGITIEDGINNAIIANSIHSNIVLGIDLNADGVTPNDGFDLDTGANNLQNFAIVTSATSNGVTTTIDADIHSNQNSTYRLDFYSSSVCDGSNHGEGENHIGSVTGTTGAFGNASGSHVFNTAVPLGHFITATVSDMSGIFPKNTSEFSECISVL